QQLQHFLNEKNVLSWAEVNQQHIRLFSNSLRIKKLSSKTIQRMLSSCRSFFNFLLKEKEIKNNPATTISAPKAPQKLPKTLDVDQISQLLSEDKKNNSLLALRDIAIMELFYSSGLRLSELSNLNLYDIDFKAGSMRVT